MAINTKLKLKERNFEMLRYIFCLLLATCVNSSNLVFLTSVFHFGAIFSPYCLGAKINVQNAKHRV